MARKDKSSGKPAQVTARDLAREKVGIYCRVSSDEQAQAGTIANQTDFAQRYCDLHQLPIFDRYLDDGVSGTLPFDKRPEGARLLRDAEAGKFGTVLVYRIDRMSRGSLRILLDAHDRLKVAGVALRSMTEPFDTSQPIGVFIMNLLGSQAELDRSTILERMTMGKHRAAREGRWMGGAPPFGYRVEGPDHDRRLVVNPAEAEVVRRIFRLYVEDDLGLIPVMDLLNAEGVPSPYAMRGQKTERWPEQERKWNTGTLSRILTNTAYVGTYRAGQRSAKEIAEYPTPPIVDRETFDAAQRLLRERFTEASRNARHFYVLRGLIHCHCGRVIVGDGNHGRQQFYYSCPRARDHFHQRAEVLEAAIWQDVTDFARNPGEPLAKLREKLLAQAGAGEDTARALADVARQIADKKREQDGVITLWRKGRITEAQLDVQLDTLNAEVTALEARQDALFGQQAQAQATEAALLSAEALLGRLRERVDQIDADAASDDEGKRQAALEDKRDLIKTLTQGMRVAEDGSLDIVYRFSERPSDSSVQTSTCTAQRNGTLAVPTLDRSLVLIGTAEMAERLGVSRNTVLAAITAGKLPTLDVDVDRHYIPAEAVLPAHVCLDCGTSLAGEAGQRHYCDDCRTRRQREASLRWWHRKAEGAHQ